MTRWIISLIALSVALCGCSSGDISLAVGFLERGHAVGVVAVVIIKLGDYHLSAVVGKFDRAILFIHPALNDDVLGHQVAVDDHEDHDDHDADPVEVDALGIALHGSLPVPVERVQVVSSGCSDGVEQSADGGDRSADEGQQEERDEHIAEGHSFEDLEDELRDDEIGSQTDG